MTQHIEAKLLIESMVTAVLAEDPPMQAQLCQDLTPREEELVRGGASIIAGLFMAIGQSAGLQPLEAWQRSIAGTNRSRGQG